MKSGFKDPIAIKSQKPKDGIVSSTVANPHYDERTGDFVRCGNNYGVGIKQPVGSKNDPKMRVDILPFGHVNTMKVK